MNERALVGHFNSSTLTALDPETGFLIPGERQGVGLFVEGQAGYDRTSVFTPEKKARVLNHLYDLWPDISAACALVPVSRQTLMNHLTVDKSFAECYQDIQERVIDRIERRRMLMSDLPSGALDRMAVLNAYRRERYNPKTEIEVKHTMTQAEASEGVRRMEQAIDVEVIETVKRLKSKVKGTTRP